MRDGQCPKCTASTIYHGRPSTDSPAKRLVVPVGQSDALFADAALFPIDCYVCSTCGYLELYAADHGQNRGERQAWFTQARTDDWQRV